MFTLYIQFIYTVHDLHVIDCSGSTGHLTVAASPSNSLTLVKNSFFFYEIGYALTGSLTHIQD